MNCKFPAVARCHKNNITIETCYGKIHDSYRIFSFDPLKKFELPDTKVSDEEFNDWLGIYRHSDALFGQALLEKSQCS